MSDDRMIQHLEEQLRDAHAANVDLRERVVEAEKKANVSRAQLADAHFVQQQLERANAKRKAAEDNAAAAQRTAKEAESARLRAEDELGRVTAQLERARAEADKLQALNSRVEQAKSIHDLLVS